MGFLSTLGTLNTSFNLGEDGSLVSLLDINGALYNLGQVTSFKVTPKDEDVPLRVLNLGGREIFRIERYGGTGEFMAARINGQVEALEIMLQNNKRQGLSELYFSVYQTIASPNPGGTPTQNLYTNCTVKVTSFGEYTLGKEVQQTVAFTYTDAQQLQIGT